MGLERFAACCKARYEEAAGFMGALRECMAFRCGNGFGLFMSKISYGQMLVDKEVFSVARL